MCIQIQDFFERLNGELEKVNQFYKTKEREFLERADVLKKQLQTLVDLKQVLDDQRKKSYSLKSTRLSTLPSFNLSSVGGSGHPGNNTDLSLPILLAIHDLFTFQTSHVLSRAKRKYKELFYWSTWL